MEPEHTHDWKRKTITVCADCGQRKPDGRKTRKTRKQTKYGRRTRTAENYAAWAEMAKTMTYVEIAQIVRRTPRHVFTVLSKMDVPFLKPPRKPGSGFHDQPKRPQADIDLAVKMYIEDGKTLQQVGEHFGVSRERVRQWLVKEGHANAAKNKSAARAEVRRFRVCRTCGETYERARSAEHFARGAHIGIKWGTEEAARWWEGVVEDYAAGMKTADISAKWGISAADWMRSIHAHGVPSRRPTGRRHSNAEVKVREQQMLDLIGQGKTITEIAAVMRCSTALVYQVATRHGLRTKKAVFEVTPEIVKEWREARADGIPVSKIARGFGVAASTIYTHTR